MKKDNFKFIALLSIPLLIVIILGFAFLCSAAYDGPTESISGEITLFEKGSHRRYGSTPMYVKIGNEKYIITGGVRWATDFADLKNTLAIGNKVTIEFYEERNVKYVVGIANEDGILVDQSEYIVGQYQQNQSKAMVFFYIAYTYLLIEIMILLSLFMKIGFEYNSGYINKVLLFKWKFILHKCFSVIFIISSLAIIAINKWLYFPTITVSLGFLFWTLNFNDKVYFGTGGFRVFVFGKKKHYGWNAIREIIEVNRKGKKIVVLNFKENYEFSGKNIRGYLALAKKNQNNFVYVLRLTKEHSKAFEQLYRKYHK